VTAFTTLLPLLTIVIPFATRIASNATVLKGGAIQITREIVDQIFTILPAVIGTLALSYMLPSEALSCRLEEQWRSYFQSKNTRAVRAIQDSLQCCGFRSTHDMAWPFADANHGVNACELQLGYDRSCLLPWREQEQSAVWMIFIAAALSYILKVCWLLIS
jgi:hypothetical protein